MKKTATLIALAGLSMAAKTEHSFLGKKPVEISSEIDPKMVIKPAHDIDPGMVRKPHKNIDQGIFVKPKKPQDTIAADDDELLLIYRPPTNIDPKMVIQPRDDIDPKMVIKPKKTQGAVLYADDNDDELLSIYRPPYGYDVDSGMVKRPPYGYDIDPKMVIKPPKEFQNIDNGIFVRPTVRPGTVWVDDEMRVVSGNDVDPGMVIKPKRGDIDPGMIRKPVKGWEVDPKIFVKPKRGDVLYADDDEMMVRRPPAENIKYLDAENDDELAVVRANHVREPRLIGDFPTKPWPGQPIYADAEDDELAIIGVSDQGIPNGKHDDELMYQRFPTAVSDLGIPARPMGHMYVRDDEFAVASNRTKPVREQRWIGDFYTKPWPGQPVYADAEDDELALIPVYVRDQTIPVPKDKTQHDDEELVQMTEFVREPRIVGDHGKSADDELAFVSSRINPGMVRRPQFENIDQGMIRRPRNDIKYFDAENDDELIMFADHSLDRPRRGIFDPRELTKPWYQQQETMYADDADNELLWYRKAEKKDKASEKEDSKVNDLKTGKQAIKKKPHKPVEKTEEEAGKGFPHVNDSKVKKGAMKIKPPKPVKPIKEADDANDDELILFADKSLDARLERRKVPIDLKELTKPWYQQQHTMYADDSLVALGELLEDN